MNNNNNKKIQEELLNYRFSQKTALSSQARQWLIDTISEQNQAEPETERKDLPIKDISDGDLFRLWFKN